jgi:hypothetical protein
MLVAIKCSPVPSRQVECVTRFAMGLVRETPQTWSWLLPHARHILLCAPASLRTCKPNGHVGTPGAMFSRPRWNGALNGHAHPDAHIPDARTPACPAQPNTRLPTSQLPWLGCAWAKRRVSSHVARTREGVCMQTNELLRVRARDFQFCQEIIEVPPATRHTAIWAGPTDARRGGPAFPPGFPQLPLRTSKGVRAASLPPSHLPFLHLHSTACLTLPFAKPTAVRVLIGRCSQHTQNRMIPASRLPALPPSLAVICLRPLRRPAFRRPPSLTLSSPGSP